MLMHSRPWAFSAVLLDFLLGGCSIATIPELAGSRTAILFCNCPLSLKLGTPIFHSKAGDALIRLVCKGVDIFGWRIHCNRPGWRIHQERVWPPVVVALRCQVVHIVFFADILPSAEHLLVRREDDLRSRRWSNSEQ